MAFVFTAEFGAHTAVVTAERVWCAGWQQGPQVAGAGALERQEEQGDPWAGGVSAGHAVLTMLMRVGWRRSIYYVSGGG